MESKEMAVGKFQEKNKREEYERKVSEVLRGPRRNLNENVRVDGMFEIFKEIVVDIIARVVGYNCIEIRKSELHGGHII